MKLYIITSMLISTLFIGCKESTNVVNLKTEVASTNTFKSIPTLPCKEYEAIGKNLLKQKVMKETINFFLIKNCFINNRGIIRLFISFDEDKNEVWSMYSSIDDRHMWGVTITPFFEVFNGDIVLIYKDDYKSVNKKTSKEERKKIRECIDQIIGNRVYQRPTRKDRWTNEYLGPNNPNPQGINRGETGTDCKRRVIFDGNGGYKVVDDFY